MLKMIGALHCSGMAGEYGEALRDAAKRFPYVGWFEPRARPTNKFGWWASLEARTTLHYHSSRTCEDWHLFRRGRHDLQSCLYRSEEGYGVTVPGLPGCCSQGADEAEALENIADAIREYLEVAAESAEEAESRDVEVHL